MHILTLGILEITCVYRVIVRDHFDQHRRGAVISGTECSNNNNNNNYLCNLSKMVPHTTQFIYDGLDDHVT